MSRLSELEGKVEQFEDEMAQKLSETILTTEKLKDNFNRMRRKNRNATPNKSINLEDFASNTKLQNFI